MTRSINVNFYVSNLTLNTVLDFTPAEFVNNTLGTRTSCIPSTLTHRVPYTQLINSRKLKYWNKNKIQQHSVHTLNVGTVCPLCVELTLNHKN